MNRSTLGDDPLSSALVEYFEENAVRYGTTPAPAKKYSVCWQTLLAKLFVTNSIVVDPPGDASGLFTETISLAQPDTESWAILPDNMYSLRNVTLKTVGFNPPRAGVPPAPSSKLEGEATIGSRPERVNIPLDETTTYTHDASGLTIAELLNFFGKMIPGVGLSASTTLPCAIRATQTRIIGSVSVSKNPAITVDFGASPAVTIRIQVNAIDPAEGGVLEYIALSATRPSTYAFTIAFQYFGVQFQTSYPYTQIRCTPKDPPRVPPSVPILIDLLKLLLAALVGAVVWKMICEYASKWFETLTASALATIAAAVTGAAVATHKSLSLTELASGMFGAFPEAVPTPQLLIPALKTSGQVEALFAVSMAAAVHKANHIYLPADIAIALEQSYQAPPLEVAQALFGAWDGTLPVVAFSQAVQAAFGGGNGSLQGLELARILQQVGFNLANVATALAAGNRLSASDFVIDLVTAFRNTNSPATADQIARACKGAGYTLSDAFDAMTKAGGFVREGVLDALSAAYGPLPYCLVPNGGGMNLSGDACQGYDFGSELFTFELALQFTGPFKKAIVATKGGVDGVGFTIGCGITQDGDMTFVLHLINENHKLFAEYFGKAPPALFDGKIHTIALRGDAPSHTYTVQFFMDAVAMEPRFSGTPNLCAGNDKMFSFGVSDLVNVNVYAIRVWSRALSEVELKQNLTSPPDPTQTIGDWNFQGASLVDRSPRAIVGELVNGAFLKCTLGDVASH
jgi:hypothetical protein